MRKTAAAMTAAAVILLGACSEGPSEVTESDATESSSPSSPAPSPSPGERRSGTLTLSSGESVSYWCAGEGSPGVLLEAGTDSGGTDAYPAAFVDPLVAETTVCTYDRPGTGTSDPLCATQFSDSVCAPGIL